MPGRLISNVMGRFYLEIVVTRRYNSVVNIIPESGTNGAAMPNIVDSLFQSFFSSVNVKRLLVMSYLMSGVEFETAHLGYCEGYFFFYNKSSHCID